MLSIQSDCPTLTKTAVISNAVYLVTICLVKVAILMLYLRTFTESKRFRYIIYAVLFALVSTHLIILIVSLVDITPTRCHWAIYPTDEEWYSNCSENFDLLPAVIFIPVSTILLDIVILVLPCPAVWKLHMAKRQKIAILLLLVAGVMYEAVPAQPLRTVQLQSRKANICWEVALVSQLQAFYASYICSIDYISTQISPILSTPSFK